MSTARVKNSEDEGKEPRSWVEFMWSRLDTDICITVARGDDHEDDKRVCFIPVEEFVAIALRAGTARIKRIFRSSRKDGGA